MYYKHTRSELMYGRSPMGLWYVLYGTCMLHVPDITEFNSCSYMYQTNFKECALLDVLVDAYDLEAIWLFLVHL